MNSNSTENSATLSLTGAFGILTVITVLVFGHFLNPWGTQVVSLLGEDLNNQFVWWRQFGFDQLRQGHLALWNPHLFSGTPFFGGFQSALLYPPNWLYMVLPLAFAINLGVALHVLLAGFFMYLWMNYRKFHPAARLLAAVMFMLGGSYFLHIVAGHLPNLCTMVWIPLLFLALDGYADHRSAGWVGLGIFAFSMEILAGHVQYAYYTALAAGFYVLFSGFRAPRKFSYLLGPLLMAGGAVLLTAVQLAAGWDATQESIRGQALPMNLILSNDLMPERIWSWFMPGFYGSALQHNYWGGGMYWEGSLFASVTGAVLAIYGLIQVRDSRLRLAGGMALFILLIALGRRTPLYLFFYHYVPLFTAFRGAAKLNILVTLWVCVLAAAGLDHFLKAGSKTNGLVRAVGAFSALLFFAALLFKTAPAWGGEHLFKKYAGMAGSMAESLFFCGLLLGILAVLANLSRKHSFFRYGLPLLAILELLVFARANRGGFDLVALEQKVQTIQAVYNRDPGEYRVLVDPTNDTLGTHGFDIWGNDPMIPYRYALFMADSQGLDVGAHFVDKPFFQSTPPVLGLARLRYVFHNQSPDFSVERLHLREMPRMELVGQWSLASGDGAFQRLANPQFNSFKTAIVESPPGFASSPGKIKGDLKWSDLSTDEMEIKADNLQPCLLVISDNYSRGWKAIPAQGDRQGNYSVMPVNFFQRGVPLQPGSHHFYLEYRPEAFVAGQWISLVSLGFYLVFLGFVFGFRKTESSALGKP